MQKIAKWWGDFKFDVDQSAQWQIGQLKFWIQRKELEWLIAHENDLSWEEGTVNVMERSKEKELVSFPNAKRYIFKKTNELIQLKPMLADRSVVTKPITPFYISPQEETVIFVSSPLWVSVNPAEEKSFTVEFPINRPSDTWFGPDTLNGEICYASHTNCRLYLEDFPFFPHRAITPLTIKNYADSPLLVEKINLPVKFLSLYSTEEGYLWTQSLNMICEDDGSTVSIKIDKDVPSYAGKASLVSTERVKAGNNIFKQALNSLFA